MHLMTRRAGSSGENAARKASMIASGFLRAKKLRKSKINRNMVSSVLISRRSRPRSRDTTPPTESGGGMRTMGMGETGASALAIKNVPTQISSYSGKRSSQTAGKVGNSQAQMPML